MKKNNEKSSVPEWVGRHPFSPDKKKPSLISKEKAVLITYGTGSHKVFCPTYVSTNHINVSHMIIPSGKHFFPPDIHSGDEIYYVEEGEAVVFNPQTGRACKAGEGEVILIPEGTWHETYNFGQRELKVFSIIAPLPWKEGKVEIPSSFPGKEKFYTGKIEDSEYLGKWPSPAKEGKQKEIVTVKEPLNLIHGEQNHIFVSFFVSDNLVHTGTMKIPLGIESDPERHEGDEVVYVREGSLGIRIKEEEKVHETIQLIYEVGEGQLFLIPEKMEHRYFNFSKKVTDVIFGVAPKL